MRRRSILAAICLLLLTGLLQGPAQAARDDRVTLKRPQVDRHVVTLSGKARGVRRVRIQKRVNGHWRTVRRPRVRHHRFRVRTRQRAGATRYRATIRGDRSRTYRVRVRRRVLTPPSSTAQQPPTEQATPSPVAPPAPPRDACGERPEKDDDSYWSCTFHDDFSGTELDPDKWQVVTGTPVGDPTNACYRDEPGTVDVDGGNLRLTVRRHDPRVCPGQGVSSYSSGWVSTAGDWNPGTNRHDPARFSQQYGRFEARMKVADVDPVLSGISPGRLTGLAPSRGLQEAFWLFPDLATIPEGDSFGTDGRHEIDIVETYSYLPRYAVPYLHYPGDPYDLRAHTAWNCNWVSRGEFHTYTLEWSEDRIEVLVDGRSCLVNTSGHAAFDKRFVVAFTQLLGQGVNSYLLPPVSPPLPATMEVDYVRVWE